jgi:hypothetical protein
MYSGILKTQVDVSHSGLAIAFCRVSRSTNDKLCRHSDTIRIYLAGNNGIAGWYLFHLP